MSSATTLKQVLMQAPTHVTEEEVKDLIERHPDATVPELLAILWKLEPKPTVVKDEWRKRNDYMDELYGLVDGQQKDLKIV